MSERAINRVMAALLVLAIVTTSGTQLRPASVPFGPGEALLLVWLALSVALPGARARQGVAGGRTMTIVAMFWLASFAILSFGAVYGLLIGAIEKTAALHDALAYAFSAVVSIQMARDLRNPERARRVARYFPVIAAGIIGLLLVAAITVRQIGPVDLWYAGVRFTALSENPNQLALLLVPLPFLAFQLLLDSASRSARVVYGACMIAVIAAGVACLSDALILAWLVCGGIAALVFLFKSVFSRGAGGFRILVYGVLLPLVVLAALIPLIGSVMEGAADAAYGVYSERGQGQVRFTIWGNGTLAMLMSPLFGLGPGPHSGFSGPNEGIEAHNTFVDWGASAGILGILVFCALVAGLGAILIRERKHYLVVGVLALMVFSMFHFVVRQPLFWAYLIIAVAYVTSYRLPGRRV